MAAFSFYRRPKLDWSYPDALSVANLINNTDSSDLNGPTANIDGSYTIAPALALRAGAMPFSLYRRRARSALSPGAESMEGNAVIPMA